MRKIDKIPNIGLECLSFKDWYDSIGTELNNKTEEYLEEMYLSYIKKHNPVQYNRIKELEWKSKQNNIF